MFEVFSGYICTADSIEDCPYYKAPVQDCCSCFYLMSIEDFELMDKG